MNKTAKLTETLFTWITFIALCIGFIVSIIFIFSLLIGGSLGESLSIFAGEVMIWAIRLGSIAVLIGVLSMYFSKTHSLTLKQSKEENDA